MSRRVPIYGVVLPDPKDSKVGDWFYDLKTNKYYIFDNGAWVELPEGDTHLPVPELPEDVGKILGVGENGYAITEGGAGSVLQFDYCTTEAGATILPNSVLPYRCNYPELVALNDIHNLIIPSIHLGELDSLLTIITLDCVKKTIAEYQNAAKYGADGTETSITTSFDAYEIGLDSTLDFSSRVKMGILEDGSIVYYEPAPSN